jgi:hypothetical protein
MPRPYSRLPESINPERATFLAEQVDTTLDAAHQAFDTLAGQLSPALQMNRYEVLVTDNAPGALMPGLVVSGLSRRLADTTRTPTPRIHRFGQPDRDGLMGKNRLLLVTSVVQDQDSLAKCRPIWEDGRKMDVAGLQAYWPVDYLYREWARWLPVNTAIYPGITGTEHGTFLEHPAVTLASNPEARLPSYSDALGEVTVAEHELLVNVARAHITELTNHLYARHFPQYSNPLPDTIRSFTFGTEGSDTTTTTA